MAHITGGGLPGNLNRILPEGCDAAIKKSSWPVPPIFEYLGRVGNLDQTDIYSAFNMGIGYVLVVPTSEADSIMKSLAGVGEAAYRIGTIITGVKKVRLI
jgi:phosphoribosylformylglycinamidine cyclo-ligase